MDIPRIFNITRVLTASITVHTRKLALSARRCVWKRGPECSTSAAVRGDAVHLARDYGVIGTAST